MPATSGSVQGKTLEAGRMAKSDSHYKRTTGYLERDVFPYLGARPVADITAPEIIPVIDNIHKRVLRDSHLRVLQSISQVLRYGD